MKILVIGDIHGLDVWRQIVDKHKFDLCVFVGDYFDSFDVSVQDQIENFNNIVAFKREKGDSVVLLTGNHDLHYLIDGERYSGYNPLFASDINESLQEAKDVLLRAYQYKDRLFSHAGVTKTWAKKHKLDTSVDVAQAINQLPLQAFGFSRQDTSNTGNHKSQGPLWVRPNALMQDLVSPKITQIVGHTRTQFIEVKNQVVFVDALWADEYLTIEGDTFIINQI